MTFNYRWKALALGCAMAGSGLVAGPAHAWTAQPPAPDNTKINGRDRQPARKTADQQTNNRTDIETTRQIRKALIADKSLSVYAHNIKIITVAGKVTLKGPVHTAAEKSAVVDKATEVAGASNVTDQISVTDKSAVSRHKSSTR